MEQTSFNKHFGIPPGMTLRQFVLNGGYEKFKEQRDGYTPKPPNAALLEKARTHDGKESSNLKRSEFEFFD